MKMKYIAPLPCFERDIKKIRLGPRERLKNTLEAFNRFVETGEKTFGFRFRKINKDKYEFRLDVRLRVVTKLEEILSTLSKQVITMRLNGICVNSGIDNIYPINMQTSL